MHVWAWTRTSQLKFLGQSKGFKLRLGSNEDSSMQNMATEEFLERSFRQKWDNTIYCAVAGPLVKHAICQSVAKGQMSTVAFFATIMY